MFEDTEERDFKIVSKHFVLDESSRIISLPSFQWEMVELIAENAKMPEADVIQRVCEWYQNCVFENHLSRVRTH